MDPLAQQPQQTINQTNNIPMEHKKIGPIIAILVIVLILIIGALYLFASRINQQQAPIDTTVANVSTTESVVVPQTVTPVINKSDDVNSLQSDLNSATNGLDNQNF